MTGLSPQVLAELVAEPGPVPAGGRPGGHPARLVVVDWLLATLVHLRHGVTHDVLTC